jgi:hypothetical protein
MVGSFDCNSKKEDTMNSVGTLFQSAGDHPLQERLDDTRNRKLKVRQNNDHANERGQKDKD